MTNLEEKNIKRNCRIDYMKQMSTILNSFLKKYPVEQEAVDAGPDDPLFKTTCDYINLRHDISELAYCLKNMAEYITIIRDAK